MFPLLDAAAAAPSDEVVGLSKVVQNSNTAVVFMGDN